MDLIEKKGETVFFRYKILCSEYARMQDFASNYQKFSGKPAPPQKLGGLFKFKSDLFNKNEVKTLYVTKKNLKGSFF